MPRYAITLEWDGRPYMGWQRQSHGPSVQAVLEKAVAQISGETVVVHAAGRTDAGVHARAMRAHFDCAKDFTPFRMVEALNGVMRPEPVA